MSTPEQYRDQGGSGADGLASIAQLAFNFGSDHLAQIQSSASNGTPVTNGAVVDTELSVPSPVKARPVLEQQIEKLHDQNANGTRAEKIAETFTRATGSWPAIVIYSGFCVTWAAVNFHLPKPVDPFPFPMLNFMLSASSALSAPIILMSQRNDRRKALAELRNEQQAELAQVDELLQISEMLSKNSSNLNAAARQLSSQRDEVATILDSKQLKETMGPVEAVTHKLSSFFGSWRYLSATVAGMAAWIVGNQAAQEIGIVAVDPNPFYFLNLTLSFMSAMVGPVVVLSQEFEDRRMRKKSTLFTQLSELQTNLLQEIKSALQG